MYNKAVLIGKVCSEVSTKTIDNGLLVGNFRLETHDKHAQYHTINCYDKTAELSKSLREGDMVFVEGRVTTRSYTDKTGQKKYVTSINAARVASVGDMANGNKQDQDNSSYADEEVPF